MNAVAQSSRVCPSCAFWGTDRHGRCAWCEQPMERCERNRPSIAARVKRQFLRAVRAGRILLADKTVPRRNRLLLGASLLPVPGPFDELALAVAVALLWWLHRDAVKRAFAEAGER